MVERLAKIKNANGIHCRPSAEIIKRVKGYPGSIKVSSENGESNLTSVLGLVSLGLLQGFQVAIQVDGPDEQQVCDDLVEMFEHEYDFPPKE